MKIAYLVAAHTDPKQLSRLLSALYIQDVTTFFIHIDKKADETLFKRCITKQIKESVFFIKHRVAVNWGSYSQCEYQWLLIQACLSSKIKFDRIFFLSGLDYPLWSNRKIMDYMKSNPTKEYIKGMNLTNCYKPDKMQTRVCLYHYRDFPIISNKRIRRLIYGIVREGLGFIGITKLNYILNADRCRTDVFCGSSWWCLTYDCLSYVYDEYKNDKCYRSYFKTALAPDELMIQTIVFNSPYSKNAILHEGAYPGLVGLTPLHYIEYTSSIAVYTEKDLEKLVNSGKMFCRKVQSGVSDMLMDMIDMKRLLDE